MNDTVDKTSSSSLAVVDNKPQRPGGCVGIFFQLFDWNRRFAKKKLFSKKLLPPVRFKQASKKFGGDEKHSKLRLIADENSGGFPSAKNSHGAASFDNEQKNENRVPGLVARLMGLDSMPASQREKTKKVPPSASVCGKAQKLVDNREGLNVEKGGIKHELRPQKLQKTSVCEMQPITKFGVEKLPFKSVLSKSRKQPTKLPSPVKSPRNLSRKRSSKLIGAATRILEPGLQTSRSKCGLTYSNNLQHPPQEPHMEENVHSLLCQSEDCDGFETAAVRGESSCRNCGYFLDKSTCKSTMSAQPLVFASPFSNCVRSSCSDRSTPGRAAFYRELEEDFHEDCQYKRPYTGQIQSHLSCQQCKPPKGAPLSLSSNYKPHRQNQMLRARERVPPRPNLNSMTNGKVSTTVMNRTKNFISTNQSSSCRTRPRVPTRMDNGRFELEKRITNSMDDSVPPGRKRRPTIVSRQDENSGFTMLGKPLGYNGRLINHQSGQVGLVRGQDRTINCGQGGHNVVPFAFNSPVKQKGGTYEIVDRRVKRGLHCDESLQKSALGENSRKTKFENSCPISGNALGALLEQKLNELNSQADDMGNAPKKTTAMILQELITALTSEVPFQHDNLPATFDRRSGWHNQNPLFDSTCFPHPQVNSMATKLCDYQPLDSEYLSPGSVLETNFSSESCHCSSVDDGLAYKMLNESLECSCYKPKSPNPGSEVLHSAASSNAAVGSKELVMDILNNVSEILCCINIALGLKGYKLDQAKEVILNAELVFHRASDSVVGRSSPIKRLLLNELEMLTSLLWMNFGCSLGIEDVKDANHLKPFVFDSIIEYLGIKFQEYPHCGSKLSRKLPLRVNNNTLILEVVEEVRRWDEFSSLGLDELIEMEMSLSLGEWTECESEAFETGVEISRHLLQILVDEIVMDLWKW